MSVENQVKRHFDADAERFDAIYSEGKGPFKRFVDDVWRGVVKRRFELTIQRLSPLEGKSVLDVGTGSGRYCIAFASNGARRVLGIDVAPEMIALAREHAQAASLSEVCEFRVGSFPEDVGDETFDAATAMGYFDYVSEPAAHLSRMRELTRGTIAASFPKSSDFRVPLRRVRFKLSRCPLFLYSREDVEALLAEASLVDYELVDMDRDLIVFART